MRIALIGAESTGKTQLSLALARRLADSTGLRCVAVPEFLREWCEREGRTPRVDQQAAIAAEQVARIEAAEAEYDLVVCDTTPLMTAVYSELLFGDRSLHGMALAFQRRCEITLLTALDLPWIADGFLRDGAHVREPVDSAVRRALAEAGIAWSVVCGAGQARIESALDAVAAALRDKPLPRDGLSTRWLGRRGSGRLSCGELCDVPECEHLSRNPAAAADRGESGVG